MPQPDGDQADGVSVLMSTFRVAKHELHTDGEPANVDRRGPLTVVFLCAVLFAGCFAIGRAASPGSASRETVSTNLQVAFAGAAIPLHLNSAPPIRLQAPASPVSVARGRTASVANAPVTARAPTETTTLAPAQAPARVVPRAPAPVAAPLPAPASARGTEGGQSKPHASPGTSFDSSG